MKYTIQKSVQAKRDIEEAFVFIAENDLDVGVYFLVAVEESIVMLGEQPFLGSNRKFQNTKLENLRMWQVKGYKNYQIIYSVEENLIKIMRVVNSKRDFNLLFDL